MRAEVILSRLEKVRKNGHNQWLACCPAHEDRSPSLSIKEGDSGRILVHCFAGCGGADIMAAIGLSLSDLYPDGPLHSWFASLNKVITPKRNVEAGMVLQMCENKRKAGERLSAAELAQEQEAFLKARRQA